MSKGFYKSFKLVKRISPGLSVRTWHGRFYLIDEEKDAKIAEAIGDTSCERAKNDPVLWAVSRIERRLNAIEREISKYEARIATLKAEHDHLNRLDGSQS